MRRQRLRLLVVLAVGVLAFVPGRFAYAAIDHPLVGTPYGTALDLCVALIVLCWMASTVTRDYSWVDRLWSILPAVYCLIVAADAGFGSARITVMAALACLWGVRLSLNLVRRDGYPRRQPGLPVDLHPGAVPPGVIRGAQRVGDIRRSAGSDLAVHVAGSSAWLHAETPLGWLDYVAIVAFSVLLVLETIADGQMWRFQQDKARLIAAGAEVERPFLTEGLFRYCRHPNCTCEQAMWVVFYLFAISAGAGCGTGPDWGCDSAGAVSGVDDAH